MQASCATASSASVVIPGAIAAATASMISPAAIPTGRIAAMTSGGFTNGSSRSPGSPPVAMYGGRTISSGTARSGLSVPGLTAPSRPRWQRLYFWPLAHQHGAFGPGTADMTTSYPRFDGVESGEGPQDLRDHECAVGSLAMLHQEHQGTTDRTGGSVQGVHQRGAVVGAA